MWARFTLAKYIIRLNLGIENCSMCNLIITYIIPQFCTGLEGFQWGMYVIEVKSRQGRCLHWNKLKIKNKKRGKIQEIIDIHYMSKQFPFPLNRYLTQRLRNDNATLKEAGYMEVDIIDPLVNKKSCEEFNNYVTPNANVTQKQPWLVVQYPNQSCQPVLDVNITPAFQSARTIPSK